MPFTGGTSGAHDDAMHQGNAKRDINGGVAAINAVGGLLVPGSSLFIPRDGGNKVYFYERDSSNKMMQLLRAGVNDFELWVNESGILVRVQTSSMKDVVNGIAALDAAGALLVPGSKMYFTRDGSDDVHIYERTSDEEAYAFHRVGADDYTFFVKESNVWKRMQTESMKDIADGIAGLDANARLVSDRIGVGSQRADHRSKIASANLRNSHDAEVGVGQSTWALQKTITFDKGISGILRIKHDNYNHVGGDLTISQVRKNGVIFGVVHNNNVATNYSTYSEDLDVGIMQVGETLELWAYGMPAGAANHKVKNFRLYYDNAPFHVVAATNSTP